jgi:BioD-like phosphotransacetylase family protein
LIRERSIPFISTAADISSATTGIGHMTVKTEVGDRDKIGVIQKLVQDHVQVDRIVDLVQRQDGDSNRQLNLGV